MFFLLISRLNPLIMNSKRLIILIILLVIGIFGVFIYRYFTERIPKYKWNESYNFKSIEPYGTQFLYRLLNEDNNVKIIKKSLVSQLPLIETKANYFFIGNYFSEDTADIKQLLYFVEIGNKAFLYTKYIPDFLWKNITQYKVSYFEKDSIFATINFPHDTSSLVFNYRFFKEDKIYSWNYIDYTFFTDTLTLQDNFIPLAYFNDDICYFSVKYGKGELFFHTIPLLFTNYHIIREAGFKNAQKCMKYFNKGDIYFDEKKQFLSDPAFFKTSESSPLRYILSQKSFRWAWYLGLALIIIYLVFRSKREQRIIPVINKPQNTTLEFNKAISVLYYQSNDISIIAEEMMKMFLLFLKNKFAINVELNKYNESLELISKRSEIKKDLINEIFTNNIKTSYGDKKNKENLIILHKSIEYFYKNCK